MVHPPIKEQHLELIEDLRTHCPHGHPFDEANNYKNKQGYYRCRVCNKLRMRKVNSTPEAKRKNVIKAMAWVNANREHYREYCRKRRAVSNAWLTEYKKRGCMTCGETFKECLDFHHRDPKHKKFDIGHRAGESSLEVLQKEIAKCDLLCSNCHRKLHTLERVAKEGIANGTCHTSQ